MAEDRNGGSREHRLQQPRASGAARQSALSLQKRQARVTVKYRRAELQKRLNTEEWIERALQDLYTGAEEEMPEEIDIDDLLVLQSDEQRAQKLQAFISELLQMLHGLHKQEELQKEGIEHPCLHSYPHHHGNAHHHGEHHEHQQRTHQSL
ncbi:protein phosphatase 1, regulatory (inhibitor) subunit 14Aa isoform X2 [Trichomycterus rosablanca]|uniref:protein phosphatase 1, regulatory (inhibitor) subunit 14Aa isoform X2 n=1 Tax=Trichomycterus rosablanca TaxID=2290929 RepID=UPI002F356C27